MTVASVAVAQSGMSLQPYLLILGKVLNQGMSCLTALRKPIPWGRQFRDSIHYPPKECVPQLEHLQNSRCSHYSLLRKNLTFTLHICTPINTGTAHTQADIMCRCWYHMLQEAQKGSHTCLCYSDL